MTNSPQSECQINCKSLKDETLQNGQHCSANKHLQYSTVQYSTKYSESRVPVPEGPDIGRRTEKKNCREPDSIAQPMVLQRDLPQLAVELVLLVLVLLAVQ